MIRLVIFDFDGTIVDSKAVYYNSINKHLNPLGFSEKQITRAIDLGLNLSRTLKTFVPGIFKRWLMRKIIMKDVLREVNNVKKCHDVGHIQEIHKRRVLVSNSHSAFVMPILKHLKLKKYFKEIYCADDFNDKGDFIKTYLKMHGLRAWECFYIGDRVADVELAKRTGMHSIIIYGRCAWDSRKALMKAKPDFIVPDLRDVKRIVERFRG